MLTFKRPILAASLLPPKIEHTDKNILAAMEKLRYPVLATIKKDGIRALRLNGSLLSRTLKPIPNKSIRERSLMMPGGFDMELWNPELDYCDIESIVMSREHPDSDKIQFHVLDWFGAAPSYTERMHRLASEFFNEPVWNLCQPSFIELPEQLFSYFWRAEENGCEGICFRTPNSPYKQGRSTLKEQYLVKLARFVREEAFIIGFTEQMENGNRENWNAVGMMDRSSCQADMIPKNTLGAFIVRYGVDELRIGTGIGLTDKLRQKIWDNKEAYIGKRIVFKHKPCGKKDLPRSPIFCGFRDDIDL